MKSNKCAQEFKALELKIVESSTNPHIVYFKEHSIREKSTDKPPGRTLFVVNIPPYADKQGLQNAFKEAGQIEKIILTDKPSDTSKETLTFIKNIPQYTFQVAYIIFSKVSYLDRAMKIDTLLPMEQDDHTVKCGMTRWIDEYNSSVWQQKALKEQIDKFMSQYDEKIQKAAEDEKKMEEADDEGWVTVTKKGKVNSFARTEKVENNIMAKEERGKKRKELQNFYTFQIRESKMKHVVALRQKFEEDKKKIQTIKQSRKFKPF